MQQKIDNFSIHYEIRGTGIPVVFLHGLCLDLNFMKENYAEYFDSKKYQQIYLDLPGMGKSSSFSEPLPSGDYLCTVITRFLDSLGIKDFYLCGHSYGGYLALGIAYRCAQQVKGLFLTCPVITANANKRITEKHLNLTLAEIKPTNATDYADYKEMNVVINDLSWQKYQKEIVSGLQQCDFQFIEQLQRDDFKAYQLNDEENIKKWQTQIPTFLLLGRHDQIVGFREQSKLSLTFVNCNLLVLDSAGHNLPLDRPQIFKSCLNYFFK